MNQSRPVFIFCDGGCDVGMSEANITSQRCVELRYRVLLVYVTDRWFYFVVINRVLGLVTWTIFLRADRFLAVYVYVGKQIPQWK